MFYNIFYFDFWLILTIIIRAQKGGVAITVDKCLHPFQSDLVVVLRKSISR